MTYETRIGRWLFAAACVAFGAQGLILGRFIVALQPMPAGWLPAQPWAWVDAAVVIVAGLSLLTDRTARGAALVLAALFLFTALGIQGLPLIEHPKAVADDFFHVMAIGAGALAISASLGAASVGRSDWSSRAGLAARLIFGVCTIGHGVMHFVFFKFTADFIPAWIPGHAFWATATGIAQIAAGLAILSGVLGRLAAILTGAMYASWFPLVHIPRVMAHPETSQEWTSLGIVAALTASALLVAGVLAKRPTPSA